MRAIAILLLLLVNLSSFGASASVLGVLQPLVEGGRARQAPDPTGRLVPVVERVTQGTLHDLLQAEARQGFTATMLSLDAQARSVAGHPASEPSWLYLSTEDGGFARRGFWLQDGERLDYRDELFVDLVVDEASVADGSFEEIFAHELGHVMLRRLVPGLEDGHSRNPHSARAITDRTTAFDEGFGIHFQGLARRFTANAKLRRSDMGLDQKPFLGYWDSNIDRIARIDGMRRNLFVQRQLRLPGPGEAVALRDHSTLFDTARLKTGDQMVASEGVVATLLYRWAGSTGDAPAELEPHYQRLFESMRSLEDAALASDSPVIVRLFQQFAVDHPTTAADAIALFFETTYGATVAPEVARAAGELAARGRLGDMEGFVEGLKPARSALAAVVARAAADPSQLDAALSTPVWLAGRPDVSRGLVSVDVNTAEREGLQALPGLAEGLVEAILDERQAAGGFSSIENLLERVQPTPASRASLARLHAQAAEAGTFSRR